jgi:hypothetical protein
MADLDARARRWLTADVRRLINRAEASNGGYITVEELCYLRDWCVLLLHGPLELDEYQRARVEQLHACALDALRERAAEREGGGGT